MSPKATLALMTVVAVVSDALLHPFYPQYFAEVFGVTDPHHVGLYISACSLVVMLSFPLWALLARRVSTLSLLVGTQVVTGLLNLVCWKTTTLTGFWLASLVAMVFKASYLLIYPYVMSLEEKDQHIGTISLLAFVVHFGDVIAGLLSGLVFQLIAPRFLFVVMALGDLAQIVLCLALLGPALAARTLRAPTMAAPTAERLPGRFVLRLGAVMLVLYFSAYLTEPFFSTYWEGVAALDNKIISGAVFALPALAALLALFVNARTRADAGAFAGIAPAVVVGLCGLWLQVSGFRGAILAGRFLYGWALFQSMVRLDLLMFRKVSAETYAVEFSKLHLFQSLGVLMASLTASSLVASFGVRSPFFVAGLGFVAVVGLFLGLFRRELRAERAVAMNEGSAAT